MKRQNIRRGIILISFLLFPITIYYLSPYLIFQGLAEGIIAGCFIFFILLFILSLFFGRLYCGWICPVGGLQEICTTAVKKKAKGGKRNLIKYFIWTPWIASVIILFFAKGGTKKIDVFYQTFHGISIAEPAAYIIYYLVVGVIVIMSFVGGKRAFCHYGCWMAPFMVLGNKVSHLIRIPSFRLSVDKDKCINCGICSKNCLMSLKVNEMVQKGSIENSECILCGNCADTCPKGVIKYRFTNSDAGRINRNENFMDIK